MSKPDLTPFTLESLTRVFATYPELTQVLLYGSRATGKATPRSDIDLATVGIVNDHRLGSRVFRLFGNSIRLWS